MPMTRLLAACFAVLLSLTPAAFAEEPPAVTLTGQTVTFQLDAPQDIDALEITGFGEVLVTQGPEPALRVKTDLAYRARVKAEARNGTLVLGNVYAEDGLRPTLTYELTVPNLDAIQASGGSRVQIGAFVADRLTLDVSGSGRIEVFALAADALTINGSGGGEVRVSGPYRVGGESVSTSGGAKFSKPDRM